MSTEISRFAELGDMVVTGGGEDFVIPRDTLAPPAAGTYSFHRVDETTDPAAIHDFEETEKNKKWKCTVCQGDTTHGKSFAKDGQGLVWFGIKLEVLGGPADGRLVFENISTYVNEWNPSSSAALYLKACGSTATLRTNDDYEAAIRSTFGPFNAVIDWEWSCRCNYETFLYGARNPKKPKKYKGVIAGIKRMADGQVDYEQPCPECKASVVARAKVKRYIVPTGAPANGNGTATKTEMPPAEG